MGRARNAHVGRAGACLVAAAVLLHPASATPHLLLQSCEIVRYRAPKLEFLRWQLPYPGACLCSTDVHAPCFVPALTGDNVTTATFCIGSGFDSRQDRLLWTGNYTELSASAFNTTTGCMTVSKTTPTPPHLHTWTEALRCVHYINLATGARRLEAVPAPAHATADADAHAPVDDASAAEEGHGQARALTAYPGLVAGVRMFTIEVCDGLGHCTTNTQAGLRVTRDDRAPVIVSSVPALTYTTALDAPGGVQIDPFVDCSDPDSTRIASLELRFVLDTYFPGEDVLVCPPAHELPAGVTCNFAPTTGILRLDGLMSLTSCEAVSARVKYHNTAGGVCIRGRRTLFWIAYDETDGSPSSGYAATTHIDVIGAPGAECPALQLATGAATLSAASTPAFLISHATLWSVPASEPLVAARIRVVGGFVPGEDGLTVIGLPSHLEWSFNPLTGVLRINGTASAGEYKAALRRVLYVNSHPLAPAVGARTFAIAIADADCWSAERRVVLNVINDPTCACLPRVAVAHPLVVTFRAGVDWTTPSIYSLGAVQALAAPSTVHGATAASPSPASPNGASLAALRAGIWLLAPGGNCSDASGIAVAAAVIKFVPSREALYLSAEDTLIVQLPPRLAAVFRITFDAPSGTLTIGLRRAGLRGVPWELMAEALSCVRYSNAALTAAHEGIRSLQAHIVTAEGCSSAPIFGRIIVIPAGGGAIAVVPPRIRFVDEGDEEGGSGGDAPTSGAPAVAAAGGWALAVAAAAVAIASASSATAGV